MKAEIDRIRKSAVFRVVAGFVLAALALAAAGWVVAGPYRPLAAELDAPVRSYVRQLQSPMLTSVFVSVTRLGSTVYLSIIGSIAGLIFILLRWWRPLLLFVITMTGQTALHHGAKVVAARPRPPALLHYPIGESFSFPSGHALSSLCLFVSLSWLVTNRIENSAAKAGIWIVTLMAVLLIGMSRIYIGIHYPTDVVAGFLAAGIWTAAVISTDRKTI